MNYLELFRQRHEVGKFVDELGIELTKIEPGYAEGEINICKKHLNPHNTVHGGCIFSLMDTIGGAAAMTRGNAVVSSSCNMVFINPAVNTDKIIAKAEEVKSGKTLLIYDVRVYNTSGLLLAKSDITYFRLEEKLSI